MRPSDEQLDQLDDLVERGRGAGTVDEPLARFLAALEEDARLTVASPAPALASVLAEGLPAADLAAGAATARGAATAAGATVRRRLRVWGRVLVTKFAALGLVAKAATAGAAVTLAASGAGAVGALPAPAQEAFDVVVGRDGPSTDDSGSPDDEPATATELDGSREQPTDEPSVDPTEDDGTVDDGTVEDGPDAGDEPGDFGERVSGDATGETDGEPGVDGREVASEASDGRSEQRGASSEARDRAEERRSTAGDSTSTVEGGDGVDDVGASDGEAGDATDDTDDTDASTGDGGDAGTDDGGARQHGDEADRGRGGGPPPGAPANGRGD